MTQFLNTPVDKSLSTTDVWTDIDLSSDIPAHATGAVFQIINIDAGGGHTFGLRKNGSSDDRCKDINPDAQVFMIVGIDGNQICEGRQNSNYVDFYLVGYTESDATLFTNGYDKSQTTLVTWTDLDLSSELPVGSVAAIFEVYNNGLLPKSWGLRKKGSTDNRYDDIDGLCRVYFITGIDANRKCQFKIESTDIDFWLLGYLKSGTAETNGVDRSLGSTGSYIDITESNAPTGATGAFVEFDTSTVSSAFGARKNGISWDKYYLPPAQKSMILVGLGESKKWEGKIATTNHDFYTLGYFASTVEWLSGYAYRKKGAVNATTAGAQTNYQLKLVVGESSGASGEDVDCESHCIDFPNDIRFTKEDGVTKQDYWIDTSSLEGTTPNRKVDVWIEVASIPASGSVDFYIYYGKSGDSGESSGDLAFPFFDDEFESLKSLTEVFIDQHNSFPEIDYPGIARMPNGKLLAVYAKRNPANTLYAKIYGAFSDDNGSSWNTPFLIEGGNPGTWGATSSTLIVVNDNKILLHYTKWTSLSESTIRQKISTDNGQTWGSDTEITTTHSYYGQYYNGIKMEDGTLILPFSWSANIPASEPGLWRSAVLKSTNGGDSWVEGGQVPASGIGSNGEDEPTAVELSNNNLYMLLRNNNGHLLKTTSTNKGTSWSTPTASSLVSPNVSACLFRLSWNPNKILVCWNKSATNRYPLQIAMSTDDCATFTNERTIKSPGYSVCYPSIALSSDNHIVVGWWDRSQGDTGSDDDAKSTRFNEGWLREIWNHSGTITVANSEVSLNEDDQIWGKTYFGYGYVPCARCKADEQDIILLEFRDNSISNSIMITNSDGTYPNDFDRIECTSWVSPNEYVDYIDNQLDFRNVFRLYKITRRNNEVKFYQAGNLLHTRTTNLPTANLTVGLRVWDSSQASTLIADLVLVRKCDSPEPTWGSWGTEEEGVVALAGSISAISTVSGAIKASKKLSGTTSATTSVSGALTFIGDYEDFTTFTEEDVAGDRIQKTTYHIDHLSYRNETTYLYKDYGAAHFDDFEHRIKVRFVSTSEAWSGGHTWLLANDVAGASWMENNNKTYISIFLLSDGSNNPMISLREMHNGSGYDDTYTGSLNTWYYVKIVKSSTSINAYVYSDSSYSILVDTLTLTLHANHTLRYLYGCNSDNDGSGRYGTLDVENFDLGGGAVALAGSISASSTVSGALKASKKLSGTITSTSTLTGILSCGREIAGTISATSSVLGALTKPSPLSGVISAISSVTGALSVEGIQDLAGTISAISTVSGALHAELTLAGTIPAVTSISGALNRVLSISGTVSSTSSVSGILTKTIALAGAIPAVSSVSGTLSRDMKLSGEISAISSLQAALSVPVFAQSRGFYYAKLGSTILTSLEKDSFRITEELNKIPSFEFEISNCAANRAAITAGITDTLTIYRRLDSTDTLMFTGRIDVDAIEYLSLERIRIPGYASYIDLNFRFHQHLNSEDAEDVGKVFDYSGSYTDYTTAANTDATNDVLPTFGGVNHALYISQGEQFFGMQVKYSTKGVQAGSTTVVFEFSKGSGVWGTLDVLDETRAFTEDAGTYYITIPHKPSDWAKDTVNSVKKFWIRARVTAGSYTTPPKLDRIKITNIDVYRVYYFDTAANSIMDDILAGTGYSMDGVDVCPSNPISMVGEYETKLRFVAGVANALTWDDSGDKNAYQWWIDTSKKVHFKQKRGTVRGEITEDLVILNNVMDYFNLSNRLHFLGNYDGLNQLRAVIEDTSSQDTHAIRELAVPEERYNNYIPLKEAAQKAMTHTKAPLQKIPATLPTTKWLANDLEVGDTITIHQPRWNIDEQALQIVRADIGPSTTKLDIGISQEHLDGLKAGLQRRLDITGIRMHGSTSLLQFGPETMNYQRVDATTVYPARLKFEIPSDARYIHKILISWKLGNYRADVTGGEESEGHDHTGFGGAGGAHEHGGYAGAGGAHDSSVLDGGLHTPTELSKAHQHDLSGTLTISYSENIRWFPVATAQSESGVYGGSHSHTNPSTGYEGGHIHSVGSTGGPSSTTEVVEAVNWGEWCESCYYWLISSTDEVYVASSSHTHSNPNTGVNGGHDHSIGNTGDTTPSSMYISLIEHNTVTGISPYVLQETSDTEDPAHAHTINQVPNHHHTAVAIAAHANHVIGTQIAHGDHSIITQAAAMIDMVLGIVEIAGGTTMMLTVNGEDVTTVDGDGTDIVITGFCNTGSNTVEIAPIVGSNTKGGATLEGRGVVFIESSKF